MAIRVNAVPAPSSPPAKMSYEEFLQWEGENQHVEWVDGEVIEMPPVTLEPNDLGGFLLPLIRFFVEKNRLGALCYDPFQMKTGPDLPGRAPDIFFIANENLSRLKDNYLEGPADLVVEIISPGSRAIDRGDKFLEYQQGGVREYWLLDPARKRAEFYQQDANSVFQLVPIGEDNIYRSTVLEGLWLDVRWLWRPPPLMDVLKAWGLV